MIQTTPLHCPKAAWTSVLCSSPEQSPVFSSSRLILESTRRMGSSPSALSTSLTAPVPVTASTHGKVSISLWMGSATATLTPISCASRQSSKTTEAAVKGCFEAIHRERSRVISSMTGCMVRAETPKARQFFSPSVEISRARRISGNRGISSADSPSHAASASRLTRSMTSRGFPPSSARYPAWNVFISPSQTASPRPSPCGFTMPLTLPKGVEKSFSSARRRASEYEQLEAILKRTFFGEDVISRKCIP